MKRITEKEKLQKLLVELKDAYRMVQIGYPYFGVPQAMRKSIAYLKNKLIELEE